MIVRAAGMEFRYCQAGTTVKFIHSELHARRWSLCGLRAVVVECIQPRYADERWFHGGAEATSLGLFHLPRRRSAAGERLQSLHVSDTATTHVRRRRLHGIPVSLPTLEMHGRVQRVDLPAQQCLP